MFEHQSLETEDLLFASPAFKDRSLGCEDLLSTMNSDFSFFAELDVDLQSSKKQPFRSWHLTCQIERSHQDIGL